MMKNTLKTKSEENVPKHGQFKVLFKTSDKVTVEYSVNPLSQEELADGWRLVVPYRHNYSTIHHFSVYLYQLPPYLWKSLRISRTDNNKYYNPINDGIYQYSVKMSKYDNDIRKLYKLIMKQYPNKNLVAQLYNRLEKRRVMGWVMIRAKNIISA